MVSLLFVCSEKVVLLWLFMYLMWRHDDATCYVVGNICIEECGSKWVVVKFEDKRTSGRVRNKGSANDVMNKVTKAIVLLR